MQGKWFYWQVKMEVREESLVLVEDTHDSQKMLAMKDELMNHFPRPFCPFTFRLGALKLFVYFFQL